MKQFLLILLIPVFGVSAIKSGNVADLPIVNVETNLPDFNWMKIICRYSNKSSKPKGRSAIYAPELYQSEDYLSVQSEYVNYENVRITITDVQGFIVKNDVIQVVAGGENLYYIGDLESGCFEITIEFDDFILCGNLYCE